MIITTTPSIEGRRISGYLGILTGEAIPGANIIRDISASVTDIVGGRSGKYEEELGKARRIALDEIAQEADRLNADAIEGVELDYEVIRDGMLMVTTHPERRSGSGDGRRLLKTRFQRNRHQ